MRTEKISVSLSAEALGVIDTWRRTHGIKSRSQVIEQALRRLREDELEAAYRDAANQGDIADWSATASDGLSDEVWLDETRPKETR